MTTDTQNHQAIRGILENALQQVLSTQRQMTVIEGQLQEIRSQIDLLLEAIDPVLKPLETDGDQTEKVRTEVSATLSAMFEQVSRIVNNTREQMLNPRDDVTNTQEALAETVPAEPPPVKPQTEESLSAESLTGSQVGQRATESLNAMIATIDETNTETIIEADMPQVQEEPESIQPEVKAKSEEKETPKGPGSTESLNDLLAKAKVAARGTDSAAIDLTPLDDDEEEDAQTVNELLKTTSGSFATQ